MKAKLLVVSFLLLFAGIAAADENVTTNNVNNVLLHRAENLQCFANLVVSQLDSVMKYIPSATHLSKYKDDINSSLAELISAAEANDKNGFWQASHSLRQNVIDAEKAILNVWKNRKAYSVTPQDFKKVIAEFRDARHNFTLCVREKRVAIAGAKIAEHQIAIGRWGDLIKKFKQRGFNTEEMQNIVNEAQTKVIEPLRGAVKSANAERIRQTLRETEQLRLHLWAKFEIEKISLLLSTFENTAIQQGYAHTVQLIKNNLNAAETALANQPYTPAKFSEIWENIHSAAIQLKQLIKELNKGANVNAT